MQIDKNIKTCLVVTYGPVPTPQYQTVEGGGMRAWGLAKGLLADGIRPTVAVNNSFPQEAAEHEGVQLTNWGLDDEFASFINTFDAIIVSYNMGDASVFIADRIADDVQLILDAYVPIYVEVSAREAKDMDTELTNYMADLKRFNHTLKRGDYFLCASEAQKVFYTGVLSALGIINPNSYRQERILIVPFGIHDEPAKTTENPYTSLGITDGDFVVLWFGGLYPWFRVEELLGAIKLHEETPNIKFVFVGGKNPFNPNPDFARQYEKTVRFAEENNYTNKLVYFVDWVDYETRVNWYKGANVVISLNQPGEENGLSWRTRVMDFVWGELAMITNGGDPLSEDLLAHNAAIRLEELSADAIAASIRGVYDNPKHLKRIQSSVIDQQKRYQWPLLMKPVATTITSGALPYIKEQKYLDSLGISSQGGDNSPLEEQTTSRSKIAKVYRFGRKGIAYARRKGILRSAKVALTIGKNALKSKSQPRKKKYVFISHPINHTGAPLVLIDIVKEYAAKYGGGSVRVVAPGITSDQLKDLRKHGVKVDKAALGIGFRIIALQLGLHKDDFVLMNTAAIYENYRNYIIHALETGKIRHANWFIHEDIEQLPVVAQEIVLNTHLLSRIKKLIKKGSLTVLVPSVRVKHDYDEFFNTKKVRTVPLHVSVDDVYQVPKDADDYDSINFLLSGTPSDGRKGQLIAISAFYHFLKNYREKNPTDYRDFKLHLVSINDDYISRQVKTIGRSLLGDHLVIYPTLPRKKAMQITHDCNAVICCSLNETFGLYVAEGMLMGHIVLRNDSAGIDEQLRDGKNGLFIDSEDVNQFSGQIEKILNRKTFSNNDLGSMGRESQKMAKSFNAHRYETEISGSTKIN